MISPVQITPNFDAISPQLKQIPRWVCWRMEKDRKVPYQADRPTIRASSTNSDTWSDFDLAKLAYESSSFDGVGIVLDGSGMIGVDIDHCVVDGVASDEAIRIADEIGCNYLEISPSGKGLRGFGLGSLPKAFKRCIEGVNVEIYKNARYLTVTGCIYRPGEISELYGLGSFVKRLISTTDETEDTEETESVSSVSSVSSVGKNEFPGATIPTGIGQRHKCIFELARYLKALHPQSGPHDMKQTVVSWHDQVKNVIGTKEWEISWAEFVTVWGKVKFPATGESIKSAIDNLPAVPESMIVSGYGANSRYLMQICLALQSQAPGEVFFMSCRTAAKLLTLHFTDANTILNQLVHDGYLLVVTKGCGKKATRYRIQRFD